MDQEAQARSRVGTTLCNKWTLEKLLGVGGMAAVYVAHHKIGRREAIKILHPEVARSPELRARFEQEAHVANRFHHPGAVKISDIDADSDGTPFLVMELLEGESLGERAQRGPIEAPELLRLVDELLDVLAAAHAQGIIHRDIKLDNLFVQRDGSLKVLDFGIARIRDGVPRPMRTRVGATLGTTPYMPPEQIKGLSIDARADLFAVGATMFRIIARRRLHEAANESDLLVKMASLPAPALCSVAPEAPRDLGLVVDRALMFRRDLRYPDAVTMQADVRALREGAVPPYASARLLQPDPLPEPPSMRPAPWGSGEHAPLAEHAPIEERTAAASPGALAGPRDAPAAISITPATREERGRTPLAEALTQVERAAPPSAGMEASLPMPSAFAPISATPALPVPSLPAPSPGRLSDDPPPITGPEPTLKSPGGAVQAASAPSVVAVDIIVPAPRQAWPVTRTLPAGEAPPMASSLPPRRSQLPKLLFVAAFFLLLGITLVLAWTLFARSRVNRPSDASGSPSAEAPDPQSDDPGLRPGFEDTRPPRPSPSIPGKGKGRGK